MAFPTNLFIGRLLNKLSIYQSRCSFKINSHTAAYYLFRINCNFIPKLNDQMAFKTSLIVQSAKNFGYWQFVDDSVLKWLCEWCLFLFVCLLAIICIFEMCYSDCFHKCWNVTDHVDMWFWRWNETKIMENENCLLRNISTKLFAQAKILQTCTISRKKICWRKKRHFIFAKHTSFCHQFEILAEK